MQKTEVAELFGPLLREGAKRRRVTDYAAILLLVVVLGWWGYSWWRDQQIPRITSISLIQGSVTVIGPAERVTTGGQIEFCPGDDFTVRYQLAIEGKGVIYADDVAHYRQHTVKLSASWRDIVPPGVRTYDNAWTIPARPDMAIDGERAWVAGSYLRTISVAASNVYINRYVPPATFAVPFRLAALEDCE